MASRRILSRCDGVMAPGINVATSESACLTELSQRGFAMVFASYLGDFDVDAETNRALDVALEMTRAPSGLRTILRTESSRGKSPNLPGPVSGIPIFYVKAH